MCKLTKTIVASDHAAHMARRGADEVISMFIPFVYTGLAYKQYRMAVIPHPTVAELMPWILDNLKPLV
jgi:hypothetical protein